MIKNLNKKNKKKGFTLIELIIVIAIIAIIAAIAVPRFGAVRRNANISADIGNAKTIHTAVTTLIAEGNIALPAAGATTPFLLDNVVDGGAGDAVGAEGATVAALQGTIPQLRFAAPGFFFVSINDAGTVTITAGDGGVRVYPNGADPYNN